nr:4Fe-4S binding protein [Desulfobulbaceae bacterium]
MTWWTRAIRSLISFDDSDQLDLFKIFPGFRRFLATRHHYAVLRTGGDILFLIVIVSGFFGPSDPTKNIAGFLTWGLLWPAIVLSWFFVGRMWCGICPFPGFGLFLQRKGFSFSLAPPKFLQKYGVYLSVFLLAVIIWTEIVAGLEHKPLGTSWLVLSMIIGFTAVAVFYKGQAWCRHLCPLGRISGAAATLAITEFRANHERCKECKTFACQRGGDGKRGCPVYLGAYSVKNNLHCLVCGHCIPNCDRDAPQFLIRNPYSELIRNKGRYITCSYIVPFLIGSQFARFLRQKEAYSSLLSFFGSDAAAFSALLVVAFVVVLAGIRLGNIMLGRTDDPVFGRFSPMVPVLVPMAFVGELVYRMEYFTAGIGDFLPTFGRQFGFSVFERLSFTIPYFPVQILSAFFMLNGAIAACYILWRFCLEDFEGVVKLRSFIGLNLLISVFLLFYLSVIF